MMYQHQHQWMSWAVVDSNESALAIVAPLVTPLAQDVEEQGGENDDKENQDRGRGTYAAVARLCLHLTFWQIQNMHGL